MKKFALILLSLAMVLGHERLTRQAMIGWDDPNEPGEVDEWEMEVFPMAFTNKPVILQLGTNIFETNILRVLDLSSDKPATNLYVPSAPILGAFPMHLQARITDIMAFQTNGYYLLVLYAVVFDELEKLKSDASNPLVILWHGRPDPPNRPFAFVPTNSISTNTLPPTPQ